MPMISSLPRQHARRAVARPLVRRPRHAPLVALAALATLAACGGARQSPAPGAPPMPSGSGPLIPPGGAQPTATGAPADMQKLYRSMGLIAGAGAVPFVASVSFLQGPTPDSTLVLLAASMPSRAFGFAREGDRYAASYTVRVELRLGQAVVRRLESTEVVRVPTFRETARTDESIIWQQFLRLAPGRYGMSLAIKDESSIRSAAEEVVIEVPRLEPAALPTPLPVYEAIPRTSRDSLPRLLARPRATVVFGQDTLLPVYIDAPVTPAPAALHLRLTGEGEIPLWDTTVTPAAPRADAPARSTTLAIPVSRMGVGIATLAVDIPGRPDTARTRFLVTLGEDLPISSFEEMVGYLRFFVSPEKLRPLREASPEKRSEVWSAFLRDTDPVPGTPENEALREYFGRIRTANVRFRDDGPIGWQTDRGIAFVALGEPDNILDAATMDPTARNRQQLWEYRAFRLQLVFIDQTGFNRWRLSPAGRGELENAIRRRFAGG
jgi:GWxTD domain-containing protein